MENVMSRIVSHADIDTRRALGVYGRLPRSDFVPRPIEPTTWRYFTALKKLLYINFDESYDVYTWELYDDIEPVAGGEAWLHGPNGTHRGIWRGLDDFVTFDKTSCHFPFHFAGVPDFKDNTSLIV
jgi:hypothetical protein